MCNFGGLCETRKGVLWLLCVMDERVYGGGILGSVGAVKEVVIRMSIYSAGVSQDFTSRTQDLPL
jgi:hypothetical protein